MSKNFKVLRDTPFHEKGVVISSSDFDKFYGPGYTLQASTASAEPSNKWFKVMEDQFQTGDIVWHEAMQRPMTIVLDYNFTDPYQCTLQAANEFSNVYKRKATKEEISTYEFEKYVRGTIIVNTKEVWYFDDPVWIKIKDPVSMLCDIIKAQQLLSSTSVVLDKQTSSPVRIELIKIGCSYIPYAELQGIARKMNIL